MTKVTIKLREFGELTTIEEAVYTAMWDACGAILFPLIESGVLTDEQAILSSTRAAQQLAARCTLAVDSHYDS